MVTPAGKFPVEGPCLIRGSEKLSVESELRVPALPPTYLTTRLLDEELDESGIEWQNGCTIPGASGGQIQGRVANATDVTKPNAASIRKPKRELIVELLGNDDSIEVMKAADAGDAVYFLFSNPDGECNFIIDRMDLLSECADKQILLSICDNSSPSKLPDYVPSPCSARYVLKYCLDIRRSPSRPVLRALADATIDATERRRLNELCSMQGSSEYTEYVRKAGISLVDLLIAFPSCKPTLARLIEILPRLLPRAYSVASYPLRDRLRFVYSLLKTMPDENGIQYERYGVCSQWLKALQVHDEVTVVLKEASKFRLPPPLATANMDIIDTPLVLIGPGTGVAPFISFLAKLQFKYEQQGRGAASLGTRHPSCTKRYLLYGSGDLNEEFLFREELEALENLGIVKLVLCESRASSCAERPRYVQDALAQMGNELVETMMGSDGALIYACGDQKDFSKGIWASLSTIIQRHLNYTPAEAIELLKSWRNNERLIEDVWS